MTGAALVRFCGTLLATSWLIECVALRLVGSIEAPRIRPWLVLVMFLPSIWTLAFLISHPACRKSVMWRVGKPWLWPVGILLQIALTFIVVSVVLVFGWGHSGWFQFSPTAVTISGGPWLLGIGRQTWTVFAANVLATGFAYSIANSMVTIGEEFCWRGFLQHHLIERFGMTTGITFLGVFWAAWHLPVILAGYNYPEHAVLGALVMFPLLLVSMSFFLAWLTLRSGSFWPAVLTHGAANSIATGVVSNLRLTVPHLRIDLVSLFLAGSIGLICWSSLVRRSARPASHVGLDRAD